MMKTYDETFTIRSRDCDLKGTWRLSAVLEAMQAIAGHDEFRIAEELHLGTECLHAGCRRHAVLGMQEIRNVYRRTAQCRKHDTAMRYRLIARNFQRTVQRTGQRINYAGFRTSHGYAPSNKATHKAPHILPRVHSTPEKQAWRVKAPCEIGGRRNRCLQCRLHPFSRINRL